MKETATIIELCFSIKPQSERVKSMNDNDAESTGLREAERDVGVSWAAAFQDPMDRIYLKKIDSIPKLPKLIGWIVDRAREGTEAKLAGDGVLVTEETLPELNRIFNETCKALNLKPDGFKLMIEANPFFNASTIGSKIPVVCLNSGLLESCSEKELKFVIGHELGHYMCGHCRCQSLVNYLVFGLEFHPVLALAAKASAPVLMAWSRYAELSADRAGYLACGDFNTTCVSFLKMGGFPAHAQLPANPENALMKQAAVYDEIIGGMGALRRIWGSLKFAVSANHPRSIERFCSLQDWRDMGYYDELATATLEERRKFAKDVSDDPQRTQLVLFAVNACAEYLQEKKSLERKEVLTLLRKAFLHGASLDGTALASILRSELVITKVSESQLEYVVELAVFKDQGKATKVKIPIDFPGDWDYAPDELRAQFIKTRKSEVHVLLYQA